MKKLLIASTALVASAGFAAADVAVTGGASMGVKYNSTAADTLTMHEEIDFNIVGSGTTDGGLTFGASMDIDGSQVDTDGNHVDDPEVYISGAFGTLTVGAVGNGGDVGGIADLGYDDIGVDDAAENGRNQGAFDVHFKSTFGDITVTASTSTLTANSGDYGIGLVYASGGYSVAVGTSRDNSAGATGSHITLGGTFGDIAAKATYTQGQTTTGYGVELGYTMGATALTFVYSDNDAANQEASYGVGFAYSLGGGATLKGAVGSIDGAGANDRATVADLGVTMSF